MDEDTVDILKSLGLQDLVQIFSENNIDKEALSLLGDEEIKELVPKVGQRLKLKKFLKSTVLGVGDITFSIFDGDCGDSVLGLPASTQPACQPVASTSSICTTFSGDEPPRNRGSLDGRAILKEGEADKGLLKEASRRKLTQLIIQNILEENPRKHISSDEFQKLSLEIVNIFPRESGLVFYSPYASAKDNICKKNASGKLYESYINRRRKLRESGVTVGTSRSSSISRSSSRGHSSPVDDTQDNDGDTSDNENIIWLTNNVDPWKIVEEKWAETADYRQKLIQSGKGTIADYFKKFPALKQPQGYTLLLDDFCRQYPGKENSLFSMIILKREDIVEYAKKKVLKIRDKQTKTTINNIIGLIDENDPETTTNVALMLLTYVVNISPTRRQKGKQPWKPSRAEIRDGFIQQVPSEANVTDIIIAKRENFQRIGRTMQPFVITVGKNVVETNAVYAVINDTVYRFNKLVTAVDCTFKLYQSTGACYPEESADIWLFLQLGFYNIKTQYDRRTQAVNTLLTDLGMFD